MLEKRIQARRFEICPYVARLDTSTRRMQTQRSTASTMTSSEGVTSANRASRGKKGPRQNSPVPRNNSSASDKDEDPVLQSIASKPSVLQNPQVTLTCYIPSQSIGAVIGRRGSTIAQIQRHAQQYGVLRLSIVGHDDTSDSVPYTFTALDWTCKEWTPVVIRGDPCAALCAAQRLRAVAGGELDDVILDIPLNRGKFSTLIGRRGSVLFGLSADTNVRIMVPQRALRIDLIQLEGELDNVKVCFEKIVDLLSSLKKKTPGDENAVSASLQVPTLPSQTKLRVVAKKTDTTIQKKRQADETWLITVWGQDMDHVETAIEMLSKKPSQQTGSTTPTQRRSKGSQGRKPRSSRKGSGGGRGGGAAPSAAPSVATSPPPTAAPDASNADN